MTGPAAPHTAQKVSGAASDLTTGDRLLRLGGIGFAQLRDPDAPAVYVTDVRPPTDDADPDEAITEIATSAGVLYARQSAPALAIRGNAVTAATILLISRRRSLHGRLLKMGYPVVRRTPLDAGSVPAVTAAEWDTAPLTVIDGYLAGTTLRAMWLRGDLTPKDSLVMVGDDPDDARVYTRQPLAQARAVAVLPYDEIGLADMFRAALTDPAEAAATYPGILGRPDDRSTP